MNVKPTRLLLAEDDEALASLLEEYLIESGYDVEVHHRGDSAMAALEQRQFDLILSDIVMPGADGLALLNYAREHRPDSMVLLMTGFSGIENALHAVEQGAYDFVSKPFQLPELRVRLDNAARYQRLLRRFNNLRDKTVTIAETRRNDGPMVVRAYDRNAASQF